MNREGAQAKTEQAEENWPERWTVDGLEPTPRGVVARLERPDGTTVTRPLADLPAGLEEGDVLAVQDGPDGVTLVRLPSVTAERRAEAQARLDALNTQGQAALPLNDDGEVTL
ncbi:DUF3006 family protein [Deinococcus sp. HMF7620]|uniref:DUF3006 family protein n=1 Tax=Deinococcus arboris TaxID=2682977 RepID=A0A7C9MS33_9DEIO|nr:MULTISPECIES: DUF3006 domain-containing protein [Deinococcus]MBZ9750054.1 DUF3006 domain-containing protein [Deinococcus betulae]MVN87724.1 DUF3006 family protein [Deinococcus arboris]